MVVFVGDRNVIHSYNMFRLPQMLDCSDEAFRSGVEEVFRDRSIVLFAPHSCGLGLLRRVSRCLAEADEP